MTTWAVVADVSTDFSDMADLENGYVVAGYVTNGYIQGSLVWSDVSDASTDWTAA